MARKFLTSILAVVALLFIVLQSLDLLGESGKILAYPGNGQAELLTYISLRAPQIIDLVLPFSVLLATIITLATLNQNSEVVAMKAAGLSAHQVLAPLLIAALGVSAITFVFSERILTRATATLDAWEAADFGPIPRDSNVKSNIWVREGDNIIQADTVEGRGNATRLTGVSVYQRDRQGGMARIVNAREGTYTGKGWKLTDATQFDVATGQKQALGDIVTAGDVRPDQFTLSKVNADGLSFPQLWTAIAELKAPRPTGRARGQSVAQAVGSAIGAIDAASGRGRRLWPRALGPVVHPRGDRHGARLCLFRRGQFRARDGQSGRLSADPCGLVALLPVPDGRRDRPHPHRGIGRSPWPQTRPILQPPPPPSAVPMWRARALSGLARMARSSRSSPSLPSCGCSGSPPMAAMSCSGRR